MILVGDFRGCGRGTSRVSLKPSSGANAHTRAEMKLAALEGRDLKSALFSRTAPALGAFG